VIFGNVKLNNDQREHLWLHQEPGTKNLIGLFCLSQK